jgi:lipopolysaccharide export system permease protein
MWSAPSATFSDNKLLLKDVTENRFAVDAEQGLVDGKPAQEPLMVVLRSPEVEISTTLTPARLVSRILTPERMTWLMLSDYIDYLERNKLDADRQIVAIWRKVAYPFTLIVMLTIAAPISYMQTRRGGVGAKIFIGILMGTGFFMLNQLALNVGLLYGWPPLVTALLPNSLAMAVALGTIYVMENRLKWSGRKLQSSIKASA